MQFCSIAGIGSSSVSFMEELPEEICDDLYQRITIDVSTMKRKFSSLQEEIWKTINDHKGIKAFLLGMGILSKEDQKQVGESSDIEEVRITLAQKYWSFLDYGNLEHIVMHKCGDAEQQMMREYSEKMGRFCERRVSEFPLGSLSDGTDHAGMKKLHVMLDLTDPTLINVRRVKMVIANILGCSASTLVLHNIENGSVLVTFLVVMSPGAELFETGLLTAKQENALKEEHVISLKYESIFFFNAQTDLGIKKLRLGLHHTHHQVANRGISE